MTGQDAFVAILVLVMALSTITAVLVQLFAESPRVQNTTMTAFGCVVVAGLVGAIIYRGVVGA
jgi:hypothetical protein